MGTFKLLMAVQHFSVEIDLHMSKNMRLGSVLGSGSLHYDVCVAAF